ncbi:MAG: hypothetical protein DRN15_09725 [Thermoprotei archaeon]|nr:MAG: hypothetical protein DRN15_09725 [Thermoprotei archaeon]
MRILMTYKFYLPNYGGVEMLIHTIAKSLVKQGYEVNVLTLNFSRKVGENKMPREEYIDGVKVIRLNTTRPLKDQVDYFISTMDLVHLRRILEQFDIIHIFSSMPSLLLFITLKLCDKLGVYNVWQPIFIPGRYRHYKEASLRLIGYTYDEYILPLLAKQVDAIIALTDEEASFFQRKSQSTCLCTR